MPPSRKLSPPPERPRRADAQRSVARILEATLEVLASDPEASMDEIARHAGVVRATIYVHFPTRESLIAAVNEKAMTDVTQIIEAAEPDRGEPAEALARIIAAAWQALGRFHALVEVNTRLPHAEMHDRHHAVLAKLRPLIERGQGDGTFRSDVPANWHVAMLLALIHAASAELHAGHMPADQVPSALVQTVLGSLSGPRTT